MTNLTNSSELSQTIEELDNLLMSGHQRQRALREGYFQHKDDEGFDVDAFKQKTADILNDWYRGTAQVIEEQIKEKHHLFHFLQHHRGSLSIVGMPMDLSNTLISFEYYLYALEDIILRLEEKMNLLVRQEIAESEHQTDILYKITYSEHTREIKMNNVLLTRLQSDSKNANFFEYVFSNQNQQVTVADIEEHTAYKLADSIHDILRDMGFKGNIKKIFFPVASKTKVLFVNPITKQYAIKNDLPVIALPKTT